MGILGKVFEQRAATFGAGSDRIPSNLENHRSFAGPLVTEDTALGLIDVYKCVSLISDAVAMLPSRAFRHQAVRQPDGSITRHGVKLPSQPLCLIDPLPEDATPQYSFSYRSTYSLLVNGNSYNEVAAVDAQGTPTVVVPIHPSAVREVRRNKTTNAIEYVMHDGGVMGHWRNGGTMLHWPGMIQPGSLVGVSPIRAAMQGIALGMAAEEFGARFFGDGTSPTGVLETDQDMEKADADRIQKGWVASAGGLNRAPRVLYGGLTWKPISVPPEEAQFIETRRFQSSQIAGGIYRVPGHLVGDTERSTSWGTGIEEQGIAFVTFTLGPWLSRHEEAMSWLLPRGQYVKKNVGALLRGKLSERYASYAVGRQWGWLSVNDIRALEDLAPVEDGDVYLQPLNMVDATEALELMSSEPGEPQDEPPQD